jgi:hypothetical protein
VLACLHELGKKKRIRFIMLFSFPTSFLAWVFVGAEGCTCLFFSCLSKKQSSACALAYKNHDKKVEGNSAKQPAFGAACRAFAAWVWELSGKKILF